MTRKPQITVKDLRDFVDGGTQPTADTELVWVEFRGKRYRATKLGRVFGGSMPCDVVVKTEDEDQ